MSVGIAVVGTGRVGISHIEGVRAMPGVARLAAVVDANAPLGQGVAQRYGAKWYASIEAALADSEVQAVVVCLPHDVHAPVALAAMAGGRHVLIEKPLGISLAEVDTLNDAAARHGVVLMAGHSRRFFRALQVARENLPAIGRLETLLYNFACIFDGRSAPPWWRSEQRTGGLVFPMLGTHSVDFTLWMFRDREPVRVYAQAHRMHPDFEGPDAASITITFADDTYATNFLTVSNQPYRHEGLLTGRDGSIHFSHEGDHIGLIGDAATRLHINGELVLDGYLEPNCFALQIQEFGQAIMERREAATSGRRVRDVYRILEAAKLSAQEGVAVDLRTFGGR